MHLFRLATGAGPAKELRVFRLQDEIQRRHARAVGADTRRLWRAQFKAMVLRAAGQLVFAVGYVAGVLLVVNDAIGGHRSVGDVVLAITLAAQVNQQVAAAVSLLHDLQRIARAHARFEWLEKYVAEREPTAADQPVPRAPQPRHPTSRTSRSAIRAPTGSCSRASTCTCRPARPSPSSARTEPARARSSSCCAASTSPRRADHGRRRGPARHPARRVARAHLRRLPGLRPLRVRRPPDGRRGRSAVPRRPAGGGGGPRPGPRARRDRPPRAMASRRSSASPTRTAPSSPAGSGRSSPSAGR